MTSNGNNITPPLYGLVLAGGKSVRMGYDKSIINWHGKEQRYYIADLLAPLCERVFISCRAEQQQNIDPAYRTLTDNFEGAGPLIGILSAFKQYPNVAWLVVACDLPLLDRTTLNYLIANRDTNVLATTFKSPFDSLPEPLITIWEPAAFEKLQEHISGGYTCPRKALIRNEGNVNLLAPPNPNSLLNANTPDDAEKVRSMLGSTIRK